MEERGILRQLLKAVQSLHINSQAAVTAREGERDWFEVKCGQSCHLFIIIVTEHSDLILIETSESGRGRY